MALGSNSVTSRIVSLYLHLSHQMLYWIRTVEYPEQPGIRTRSKEFLFSEIVGTRIM